MKRISKTISMQAPTGGWNARDALANMKPSEAVILDNLVAKPTEVVLRSGCSDHVTGITGTVETLSVYNQSAGTSQMFGAAGTAIYNVTTAGAVGAAVQSGLTNARWQDVNFQTTGGKYLYMVNGADKPRLWDGTVWVAVDNLSVPAITGVTTTTLVHVNVFQRRLWFTQKDTFKVWYLPVEAVGGAALAFDLQSLFPAGGYLVGMGTWTLDSGSGMDDHAAFISSEGEVAIYRGTDPAAAATWALVGVYRIGQPIGRRCYVSYGSDLLLITKDGVVPLSKALASSRVNTGISITDKIQKAVNEAAVTYAATFGWELSQFAEQSLLILNIPSTPNYQYVMCTLNGSWTRFIGWPASCFARMGDRLYYGQSGKVSRAYSGTSDAGVNINFEALPSFQYHGGMNLKRYTMARTIVNIDNSDIGVLLGINVDFDTTAPTGATTFASSDSALWDIALWDAGLWGGTVSLQKNWQTVGGVGYCAAIHMKGSTRHANFSWQSTDYVYEPGVGMT